MVGNTWEIKDKKKNLLELFSYLLNNKEAKFTSLREHLKVSKPTLTDYIKVLESQNKIEHFDKTEDRRDTWYRIKSDKNEIVKTQVAMYEATQFIESLANPIYGSEHRENFTVSIFASKPMVKDRQKAEKDLRKKMLPLIAEIFELQSFPALKPSEKLAFVVTFEGKKVFSLSDGEPQIHSCEQNTQNTPKTLDQERIAALKAKLLTYDWKEAKEYLKNAGNLKEKEGKKS